MALRATPTGRPLAHGGADELVVDVETAAPASLEVEGGAVRLCFDGTTLHVDGPERDLLVRADGMPVTRLRAGAAAIDLSSSVELRRLGGRYAGGLEGLTAAAAADEADGIRHRYEIEPDLPRPGDEVAVRVRAPAGSLASVRAEVDEPVPLVVPGRRVASGETEEVWEAVVPPQPAGVIVRYRVVTTTAREGTETMVADAGVDFAWPRPDITFLRAPATSYSYAVSAPPPPAWFVDAVMYHLLVDRFAADGGTEVDPAATSSLLGFAGGTIDGATARLDHLAALGVTALLVSPLTPGEMHVCYDVKDHTAVEPRLGTEASVRRFLDEAHRRGMRVVLDTEMSYVGMRHPRAADWTLSDPTGRPLGWIGGNPTFRPVDHFNTAARRHLLDAARWWLDLGFDGFRLDSAHAAPFDFWTDFGAAVRDADPEAVTFAEATRPMAFCRRYRGRLTGFLDFETQRVLRGFAGDATVAPTELARVADAQAAERSGLVPVAFFECHDGDRFLLVAGDDRRRLILAATLLVTLPGVPLLYYGTEVGMTQREPGEMDIRARQPMPWHDHDDGLVRTHAGLTALRRRSVALRRGSYRTLAADDASGVFAFERGDAATGERVAVVANASERSRRVDVPGWGPVEVEAISARVLEEER